MNNKRFFWLMFFVALVAGLFLLPIQAGAAAQGGWLPFAKGAQPAQPTLALTGNRASQLSLTAEIPGAYIEEKTLLGQMHTALTGEGFVYGTVDGAPDVPVIRRDIEIPFSATVAINVTGYETRSTTLKELGLPDAFYPHQPSQPKCGEAVDPCAADAAIYGAQAFYPKALVEIINDYVMRGHRIITLEIHPVQYQALTGELKLYSQIMFDVELTGVAADPSPAQPYYESPAFQANLADTVLNYNLGRDIKGDKALNYLIITHDDYYTGLANFITLKQSQGFNVTVARLSVIGSTTTAIKAYITSQYQSSTPPDYVLLVGDTDKLPAFDFPDFSGMYTDLYYVTMDGGSDYVPDIYRGRFPVRSTAQLANMVSNAIAYNNASGEEAWVKKAAFLATDDGGNYTVAEGTHNYVISNYTLPRGYSGIFPANPQAGGDKLYAITNSATTANVVNAVNDHRAMIIYSGHGGSTSWAGPVFTQTNVRNIAAGVLAPYVAGHACVTADYSTAEAFSDTWVIQNGKGAVVYVGASNNSYWGEDDVLEKTMFTRLFSAPPATPPSIASMLYDGLSSVQTAYPSSAKYYWEEYNLFGDPATTIVLQTKAPDFTLSASTNPVNICATETAQSSILVAALNGFASPVTLSVNGLPSGATGVLDVNPVTPTASSQLTLQQNGTVPAGSYAFTVNGQAGALTHDLAMTLKLYTATAGSPALLTPADAATGQVAQPVFTWQAASQAASYTLQVATDAAFTSLVINQSGLTGTSYTPPTPLETRTVYYWRVKAINTCGESAFTPTYTFSTAAAPGDCDWGYEQVTLQQIDFESGAAGWLDASSGSYHWALTTVAAHSPTHSFFAADVATVSDQRLVTAAVDLPASADGLTFNFWTKFNFEGSTTSCYDGGVLEISTNGGSTWSQLPSSVMFTLPYTGTIYSSYSNPLGSMPGWCGAQADWVRSVVDLAAYAGQTVQLRFRLGSDFSVDEDGWYVDDASVKMCVPPTFTHSTYIPLISR